MAEYPRREYPGQTGPEVRPLFDPSPIPEGVDPAMYAPNGGILLVKNLNHNSTHPNAWRPPTWFENQAPGYWNHMNLTTWRQPTFLKTEIHFEKDGLGEKLQYYGFRSILLGNIFALYDINMYAASKALTPMGKLARWAYVVSPYVAMTTCYIGTHHCLNKLVSKENQNKPWVYGASVFSPAAIWGTYKYSFGSFVRFWAIGAFSISTIKTFVDLGLAPLWMNAWQKDFSQQSPMNNPLEGFAKQTGKWANRWMGGDQPTWPVRNFDEEFNEKKWQIEPSWKKHVPEEDREKGPRTGL